MQGRSWRKFVSTFFRETETGAHLVSARWRPIRMPYVLHPVVAHIQIKTGFLFLPPSQFIEKPEGSRQSSLSVGSLPKDLR